MSTCEICNFRNPKATTTAVILRDNKVLLLKRGEEPHKGMWDFPGGYMQEGEVPEAALLRELKEELGIDIGKTSAVFMRAVPGTAEWRQERFPILSLFFLVDTGDAHFTLNGENSHAAWVPLKDLEPNKVAFDSNRDFASYLKERFMFDVARVRELVGQLDGQAVVKEQSIYKAMLDGHVSLEYDEGRLIGMGWIFPRQTMLRKQAVVEDMIVDEAYRGRGLGLKLLDALVCWAAEEGVEMIELTSNPKRVAANELYKKYGFQLHPTNHYLYKVP